MKIIQILLLIPFAFAGVPVTNSFAQQVEEPCLNEVPEGCVVIEESPDPICSDGKRAKISCPPPDNTNSLPAGNINNPKEEQQQDQKPGKQNQESRKDKKKKKQVKQKKGQ